MFSDFFNELLKMPAPTAIEIAGFHVYFPATMVDFGISGHKDASLTVRARGAP
jgi:hypothetical protein